MANCETSSYSTYTRHTVTDLHPLGDQDWIMAPERAAGNIQSPLSQNQVTRPSTDERHYIKFSGRVGMLSFFSDGSSQAAGLGQEHPPLPEIHGRD